MRRLVDKVEDAEGMERLTELVRAAEPFRPNPFTKRRMLLRLKHKGGGQRPLLKAWIPLLGLMFIVGSAVAGTGWWRARNGLVPPSVTEAPAAMPSVAAPAAPPSAAEPPPPPEATPSDTAGRESDSPPPKSPPAKRGGAIVRETKASRAPATTSDEPTPLPRSAEDGEDPTPVVRAIRALRSERNPALAEQLLQQYLRTNPNGALAEDALALLIETASALRSTSAADRAERYLELYPNGRYRATARRVLSARP
jgi:TolA-binding protein